MKLIETYALNTGSMIDSPHIQRNYYPLPFKDYITVQNSSGMDSKNYDYWQDVIDLVMPFLNSVGIRIVQIGDKDTPQLNGTYTTRGRTSIYQAAYILANSKLHMGNDSFACHVASAYNVPLVALYGPTSVANHSPFHADKDKLFLHESHRNGDRPSFASKEAEKTVNMINPEDVANSVLRGAMGLKNVINRKTVYIGKAYPAFVVEYIPNSPFNANLFRDGEINVRMDHCHNEELLVRILQTHKCNILADTPIDLNIIRSFRQKISKVSYEVSLKTDEAYIKELFRCGVPVELVVDSNSDLDKIRFRFLDFDVESKPEVDNKSIDLPDGMGYNDLKFKSNKFILSRGKAYISYAHEKKDLPIQSLRSNEANVIDSSNFWDDLAFFNIYY